MVCQRALINNLVLRLIQIAYGSHGDQCNFLAAMFIPPKFVLWPELSC